MTFTPGVNVSCTTVVSIIDDDVLENDQTFSVVLSTADSNILIDLVSATITIVDNDGKTQSALSTLSVPFQLYIFSIIIFFAPRCHCRTTAVILHCE